MAGQSVRDIRRRIVSVENTKQITRAMELVSASKLRRTQSQVTSGRPFAEKLREVLGRLTDSLAAKAKEGAPAYEHPLLKRVDEPRRVLYLYMTADRGLAGGYNANLNRYFTRILADEAEMERDVSIIVVGRRGRDFLVKMGVEPVEEILHIGDEIPHSSAQHMAEQMMQAFTAGEYDEINIVYSEFVTVATQRPTKFQLLPLTGLSEAVGRDEKAREEDGDPHAADGAEELEYIYEPNPEAVFNVLLPRFVTSELYRIMVEAKASEHGARMTAMRAATENAEEMIDELRLNYNRARQAGITKEISEIVGGAEAIAGN